ncbi:MAG TPA: plastocyanin/azurin family copper-binding protein [Actinomycetota bacterium]|jgi:plastocyanin|nr:plastocyanin/azurin family copper-binding protein [Actinomycetota bacterium]
MDRRRVSLFLVLAVCGLMLVALPAALAGGGGGCHKRGDTQDDTTVVDMKANCFGPTVTNIDVGDTVKWTNSDTVTHAIAGATGDWGTKDLAGKQSVAVKFDKPGVYAYWCPYHMGMIGAVMVGDGRPDSKAAGSAPVAVAVEEEPPSGGAPATGEQTSARADAEGIAPVAAVAIALIAGVAGYGFALVVRRRDLAVPAKQAS